MCQIVARFFSGVTRPCARVTRGTWAARAVCARAGRALRRVRRHLPALPVFLRFAGVSPLLWRCPPPRRATTPHAGGEKPIPAATGSNPVAPECTCRAAGVYTRGRRRALRLPARARVYAHAPKGAPAETGASGPTHGGGYSFVGRARGCPLPPRHEGRGGVTAAHLVTLLVPPKAHLVFSALRAPRDGCDTCDTSERGGRMWARARKGVREGACAGVRRRAPKAGKRIMRPWPVR